MSEEILKYADKQMNPRHWPDEILYELTAHWEHPVTPDTPYDFKAKLRNAAWGAWMKERDAEKHKAIEGHIRKVKESYEKGIPIPVILRQACISEEKLTKWMMKYKWKRPPDDAPTDVDDIAEITEELQSGSKAMTLVTTEEDEDLPVAVREMNEQKRLLELTPGTAEQVPIKNWGRAMKLKIGKIAFGMLEELNALDGPDLLDPETVKTVKSLADIAKTYEERVAEDKALKEKPAGSSLNMYIMQGSPLPKKGKIREIKAS